MRLKAIYYDPGVDVTPLASMQPVTIGDENPKAIEVVMSIEEALAIARHMGRLTGKDPATSTVYACLAGVFNHWDDGIDEATRHLGNPPLETK